MFGKKCLIFSQNIEGFAKCHELVIKTLLISETQNIMKRNDVHLMAKTFNHPGKRFY